MKQFEQLYAVNATWTGNDTLREKNRLIASGHLVEIIQRPVEEALSGILWLFPCAVSLLRGAYLPIAPISGRNTCSRRDPVSAARASPQSLSLVRASADGPGWDWLRVSRPSGYRTAGDQRHAGGRAGGGKPDV